MSFSEKMISPLHDLAVELLPLKQYSRLYLVAELLHIFSSGAWRQMEEDQKRLFIIKLQRDFHVRAWDDWDWRAESSYSKILKLVAAEAKGLARQI